MRVLLNFKWVESTGCKIRLGKFGSEQLHENNLETTSKFKGSLGDNFGVEILWKTLQVTKLIFSIITLML